MAHGVSNVCSEDLPIVMFQAKATGCHDFGIVSYSGGGKGGGKEREEGERGGGRRKGNRKEGREGGREVEGRMRGGRGERGEGRWNETENYAVNAVESHMEHSSWEALASY